MHVGYVECSKCNDSFEIEQLSLIPECAASAVQVSRTDANALIALDPVDLTVTKKFNYTSILPEAQVCQMSVPACHGLAFVVKSAIVEDLKPFLV